jgi:microcompartment protein CcmL/EutN
MRYILISLMFIACSSGDVKDFPVKETSDSVIVKPLHDSVEKMLPVVEKVIIKKEKQIIYKYREIAKEVQQLKQENSELKEQVKITKTVVVRDTIYIKEKTNFWGKKKVSTDSSSSVDSTIIQQ